MTSRAHVEYLQMSLINPTYDVTDGNSGSTIDTPQKNGFSKQVMVFLNKKSSTFEQMSEIMSRKNNALQHCNIYATSILSENIYSGIRNVL